jgi:hypothetical protein
MPAVEVNPTSAIEHVALHEMYEHSDNIGELIECCLV